jgi:hypothetical protein
VNTAVEKNEKGKTCSLTWEHEVHAVMSSPVSTIGTARNGRPTTVEQNNISI